MKFKTLTSIAVLANQCGAASDEYVDFDFENGVCTLPLKAESLTDEELVLFSKLHVHENENGKMSFFI